MTAQEIEDLCNHLRLVFESKIDLWQMSNEQLMFWNSFQDAAYGADLLSTYSDLAHQCPETSLRLLHCFILGHAFGSRYGLEMLPESDPTGNTTH